MPVTFTMRTLTPLPPNTETGAARLGHVQLHDRGIVRLRSLAYWPVMSLSLIRS